MNTIHPANLYIDAHLLQTLPFHNLNRDERGAPKQMLYGGVERNRVSSQCWKYAARGEVEKITKQFAKRTRNICTQVSELLQKRGWPAPLADHAGRQIMLSATGGGADKRKGIAVDDKGVSAVTFFVPEPALESLADLAARHRAAIEAQLTAAEAGKKESGAAAGGTKASPVGVLPAAEVAAILRSRNDTIQLMGRMLTELPDGDVDGVVQVAHAFTVHGTEPEIDFFSVVDDCPRPDARGAAGTWHAEYSAGVLYRYANINVAALAAAIGDPAATAKLTTDFLTAFTRSMPTGKQNATAAQTLPDLVYLSVRADRPFSLAAAFDKPIAASRDGWAAPARARLADYAGRAYKLWGSESIVWSGYCSTDDTKFDALGTRVDSFTKLTEAVSAAALSRIPAEA